MKNQLKKIPVLGAPGRRLIHRLRHLGRVLRGRQPPQYVFSRLDVQGGAITKDGPDQATARVLNLLNYTKTSASAYSGDSFPAGYHSLDINGLKLRGQRDPHERTSLAPIDFGGKTVLDIGCNQGGMLFAVAGQIAHGVGIDYDSRVINAANRIRSHARAANVDFYVFDLQTEDLQLIRDLLPVDKVDVTFLLSVCMWIDNWREVIQFVRTISISLLFESNGKEAQQAEQVEYLRSVFPTVALLSQQSDDDSLQKKRKLYFCH